MGASNVKWVRLGDYIEQCDERNTAGNNYPVIGINRDKTFMPTVANLDGVDIAKYKVITKGMFVFSGMQTGRDICIRIGLYGDEQPALISPAYTTFIINDEKAVLPEYFFMYFNRAESDRYGWFISDSSVRANLDWSRFLDIEIPLPSPTEQQKVAIQELLVYRVACQRLCIEIFLLAEFLLQDNTITDQKFLDTVNSIIEKNLDNIDFDMNMMARELGLSRSSLYAKIGRAHV